MNEMHNIYTYRKIRIRIPDFLNLVYVSNYFRDLFAYISEAQANTQNFLYLLF